MEWFTGVMAYCVMWWVCFYAILPWHAAPEPTPLPGHEPSAPKHTYLKEKCALTTLIGAVLWVILYKVLSLDWPSVHTWTPGQSFFS